MSKSTISTLACSVGAFLEFSQPSLNGAMENSNSNTVRVDWNCVFRLRLNGVFELHNDAIDFVFTIPNREAPSPTRSNPTEDSRLNRRCLSIAQGALNKAGGELSMSLMAMTLAEVSTMGWPCMYTTLSQCSPTLFCGVCSDDRGFMVP